MNNQVIKIPPGLRKQFGKTIFIAPTREGTLLLQTKEDLEESKMVINSLTNPSGSDGFPEFFMSGISEVEINDNGEIEIPEHLMDHMGELGELVFTPSIKLNRNYTYYAVCLDCREDFDSRYLLSTCPKCSKPFEKKYKYIKSKSGAAWIYHHYCDKCLIRFDTEKENDICPGCQTSLDYGSYDIREFARTGWRSFVSRFLP